MNNLQVQFNKFKKQVEKACRKKHGDVTIDIQIGDYTFSGIKPRIYVWRDDNIICLYCPNTVLPKQVVQYIRHNDGV